MTPLLNTLTPFGNLLVMGALRSPEPNKPCNVMLPTLSNNRLIVFLFDNHPGSNSPQELDRFLMHIAGAFTPCRTFIILSFTPCPSIFLSAGFVYCLKFLGIYFCNVLIFADNCFAQHKHRQYSNEMTDHIVT